MELIDQFETQTECIYKDEQYLVRDNGAVYRKPKEGKRPRRLDEQWTFGTKDNATGYMTISGHRVHIIVATAFHGARDSKKYVVDHIDTNRCNNRKDNLRWLTKLENVLLNPITRSKIEYLCGSVDNFLKNPSVLNGHESEDTNFGWMRAVSKEEAENTLKNRATLISNPRPKQSNGKIGDWIFQNPVPAKTRFEIKEEEKQRKAELAQKLKEQEKERKEKLAKQRREEAEARKKEIQEETARISETILSCAEEMGWSVKKRAKGINWKSDFLITSGDRQVAIKLFNPGRKPHEEYAAMKNEGIEGLWIGYGNSEYDEEWIPAFHVETSDGIDNICLHGEVKVPVKDFLQAFVENRVALQDTLSASAIKVRFVPTRCYRCGANHPIYLIQGCFDGDEYFAYDKCDSFNPTITKSINRFIESHKEHRYTMGQIKERHSNTMGDSYMSFGCPACDSIVGNHYVYETFIDYLYESDDENVHRIDLIEPIELPIKHWTIN